MALPAGGPRFKFDSSKYSRQTSLCSELARTIGEMQCYQGVLVYVPGTWTAPLKKLSSFIHELRLLMTRLGNNFG